MGQYLAKPVLEKTSEEGGNRRLRYGASAMQGWRVSMEDAHIAMPDFAENQSLFAVFDGHGGREVALFCKRHMPRELRALESYRAGNYEQALTEVFLRMDVMIGDVAYHNELEALKNDSSVDDFDVPMDTTTPSIESSDSHEKSELPSNNVILLGDGSSQEKRNSVENGSVVENTTPEIKQEEPAEQQNRMPLQDALVLLQRLAQTSMARGGVSADEDSGNPLTQIREMSRAAEEDRQAHICRLPNHRITAGCTAVAALIVGNVVYVANAGDSKAVISRMGKVVPMSFEHKPQSDIEKSRIEKAGGFVNAAGRVNNNLNLSRSIGDLKYKTNSALPQKDQMITADPDHQKETITEEHKFLFMACDGVWDVMTNQDSVDFVGKRLESGETSLSNICEEVLDYCVADDPRRTSGIGGDNMSCIIVQFLGINQS
eukprot:CAMPEP_0182441500 /NCGR_PEP_ID=MMETSP1172-20130603/475_1 /TAXON_ID=708627 /ORGANISM="Timspurckia oligopyrenoides, Strain CCMP3278" /LENGTH=430 /DNA_ID=CAMNT_0024635835 /DNA_START=278 /DNA_END=1570 /DNA_ORIENTATION=+